MALGRHCTQWHWESTDIRLINDWHCPTPAHSHTCPVSHLILQSHNDSNVLDSIKMVENLEIRQHSQIRSFRWKCLLQTDEYGIEEWERDSPLVLNMYSIYIYEAQSGIHFCVPLRSSSNRFCFRVLENVQKDLEQKSVCVSAWR